MASTEWWQRGPVDGVPAVLQPVAHILLQVRESVDELVQGLTDAEWNARPAGVASAAFHVRHMAGVIDRLFTYARGEVLTDAQKTFARAEAQESSMDAAALLAVVKAQIEQAMKQLGSTDVTTLLDERKIGRAGLPATVMGALVHGAEHAARHAGQCVTTIKILKGV